MNDKEVELMTKHPIEGTVNQFEDICDFMVTLPCAHHLWGVNYEV